MNKQLHLVDHIRNTCFPDPDILSLEHQVAAVLFLTWRLKLPTRPLKVFNSVEINNLLSIQSAAMTSWFSDYNASVKKERLNWIELVTNNSTGYIHKLADNHLDTDHTVLHLISPPPLFLLSLLGPPSKQIELLKK